MKLKAFRSGIRVLLALCMEETAQLSRRRGHPRERGKGEGLDSERDARFAKFNAAIGAAGRR